MKKEIRLYNVVFPIWFLVLAWPAFAPSLPLLLLLLPANFLVDSLVLLLAARRFQIPEVGKLWKKSVWKIWLFGFLCDFAGGGLIMLLCFLIEGGISQNALLFPFATLYALPGWLCPGCCCTGSTAPCPFWHRPEQGADPQAEPGHRHFHRPLPDASFR